MGKNSKGLLSRAFFCIFVLLSGCASPNVQPVQQAVAPQPVFPPQAPMEDGDYIGFFKENSEELKSCQDPDKCVLALFNITFLHCYPKSPYYDPQMGLKYIADLNAAAPDSPWARQAEIWKLLIERGMRKYVKKRPSREDLKMKGAGAESKEAAEAQEGQEMPDLSANPAESAQESDWETDRQRLEEQIKAKDEIIKKLNSQLERSRQIDIEMEKKERGLLK